MGEQFDKENKKQLWLQFISADSEEELNMLNTTNNAMIQKGVGKILEISEDEKIKEIVRQREKSEMDYYAGLSSALKKGIEQGIAQGIAQGMAQGMAQGRAEGENSIIEKMRKSGLSNEQIEAILKS